MDLISQIKLLVFSAWLVLTALTFGSVFVLSRLLERRDRGEPGLGRTIARAAVARMSAWRDRRRTMRELMALDDRMLRDIGVERSTVPAIVSGLSPPLSVGAVQRGERPLPTVRAAASGGCSGRRTGRGGRGEGSAPAHQPVSC